MLLGCFLQNWFEETHEYVELYNNDSVSVDISYWRIVAKALNSILTFVMNFRFIGVFYLERVSLLLLSGNSDCSGVRGDSGEERDGLLGGVRLVGSERGQGLPRRAQQWQRFDRYRRQ